MATRALSNQAKDKRGGGCALVLFGLVFAGAGAAMMVFMLVLPMQRVLGARDWREVPCTVVSSSVTTHSDSDGTTYGVEITYRYEVDGRTYTSKRRSFGVSGSSSGRSGKERFVAEHPPGKTMVCYVDPADASSAVLNRGLSSSMLWGLFPLPFLLIGLSVLWFGARAMLGLGTSDRAKSAGVKVVDGAVPMLDPSSEGETLRLRPGKQRVGGAVGLLFFGLIWNGFVGFFVLKLIGDFRAGQPDVCASLFMIPFVLVGVVVIGVWFQKVLLVFAPVIELELDRPALPVGGSVQLTWHVPGRRGRLTSMSIDLVGEERATYRRGTDTITDTHTFYKRRLAGTGADEQTFETLPTVPDRGTVIVTLPADTMHSFKAGNNRIQWRLKVRGSVPRWPDPVDSYDLTVVPMRMGDER